MGTLKQRIIEDMEPTEHELARRWIPVSEQLPEDGESVLVWSHGEAQIAWLNHFTNGRAYFVRDTEYNFEPTHWMPLPAPPGVES